MKFAAILGKPDFVELVGESYRVGDTFKACKNERWFVLMSRKDTKLYLSRILAELVTGSFDGAVTDVLGKLEKEREG